MSISLFAAGCFVFVGGLLCGILIGGGLVRESSGVDAYLRSLVAHLPCGETVDVTFSATRLGDSGDDGDGDFCDMPTRMPPTYHNN